MDSPQSPPDVTAPHVPQLDATDQVAESAIVTPAISQSPLVDRYQLGNAIAHGGMGAVYRAVDTVFQREVAVKVLLQKLAGTNVVARFEREAGVTARLQHPSIPPIHDMGLLPDGRPFLAMKLIRGKTLAERIARRRAITEEFDEFTQVFEQICQAVAFAHSRGVIHRDLKPLNVMVGAFNEVQVMDWGLAREGRNTAHAAHSEAAAEIAARQGGASDGQQTQEGAVMGTPAYMPPEQARGEHDSVNERSDVFALGGILCEILTGFPPYLGPNSRAVLADAAVGNLADAKRRLDLAIGVFSSAEGVVAAGPFIQLARRCLMPDPADRPAHAGEVAVAVHSARRQVQEFRQNAEVEGAVAEAERGERNARFQFWMAIQFSIGTAIVCFVAGILFALYGLRTS